MRILFLGDVVGRAGRDAVVAAVPVLRTQHSLDFIIVNGENAAHGFGISPEICLQFYAAGVDCVTTGNHIWDQRAIINHIGQDRQLLRPLNFPGAMGRGFEIYSLKDGRRILVVNAMARLFMELTDNPFTAIDQLLIKNRLGSDVQAIVLDFHGEATAEKMAMGHFCDGRVSLVVGTHTHIPTADAQILPGGTAYQTDAGMCGDYNSVIGMEKAPAIARFVQRMPTDKLSPASGEASVCGLIVETDDVTGLAKSIQPLRMGGQLQPTV
jgi:metallophosphoesterase (TIGR00282 family)